jgi:hypothetical protein
MLKRFFFGLALGLAVLVAVLVVSGGTLVNIVDIATLVLILFMPFASGFISHGPSAMGRAIALAFASETDGARPDELKRALCCLRALGRYTVMASLVGVFLGVVLILENLNVPSKIGPCMAVCLISALYASLLMSLFFGPLVARLEDRIISAEAASR